MIIEKTNIKAFAKSAFTFTTILMIIYLSVSVFGIIIVEEDVHFIRAILTISCFFFVLVYYLLIKHYCF